MHPTQLFKFSRPSYSEAIKTRSTASLYHHRTLKNATLIHHRKLLPYDLILMILTHGLTVWLFLYSLRSIDVARDKLFAINAELKQRLRDEHKETIAEIEGVSGKAMTDSELDGLFYLFEKGDVELRKAPMYSEQDALRYGIARDEREGTTDSELVRARREARREHAGGGMWGGVKKDLPPSYETHKSDGRIHVV